MVPDTIHHLLLVAFGCSNHAMVSRTRGFGLMPGQPKVLEFVAKNEGCLQRDIARACAMDRATVTGVLARMEGGIRGRETGGRSRCASLMMVGSPRGASHAAAPRSTSWRARA